MPLIAQLACVANCSVCLFSYFCCCSRRSGLCALQIVAVKQLDRNGLQGNREFLVEVLMLSLLHHPNLVQLIGYCADGDQRLLVYEFMAKGALEDHLHGEEGAAMQNPLNTGAAVTSTLPIACLATQPATM